MGHFSVAVLAIVLFCTACGSESPTPPPPDPSDGRGPAEEQEEKSEAQEALEILGALGSTEQTQRCARCHTLNVYKLRQWATQSERVGNECFPELMNPETPPHPKVFSAACLARNADFEGLGVFAASLRFPEMEELFREGLGEEIGGHEYNNLVEHWAMPKDNADPFSKEEFAKVVKYAAQGMPLMEKIVAGLGDPPRSCEPEITKELQNYLAERRTKNWQTQNQEAGLLMFACQGVQNPKDCFKARDAADKEIFLNTESLAGAENWNGFPEQFTLRKVALLAFPTLYWMRVSPDGRFIANGFGGSELTAYHARVTDLNPLLAGAPQREIMLDANWDPDFLPDGSGFLFMANGGKALICPTNVLRNPATQVVTFKEPGCLSTHEIGTYPSAGSALDGGDYIVYSGHYISHAGQTDMSDGAPDYFDRSYSWFTPMVNTGQGYDVLKAITVHTPYRGDWIMSPSQGLLMGRIAGLSAKDKPTQQGFAVHIINKKTGDQNPYSLTEAGRFCDPGMKGAFSFSERFYAFFHYVTETEFADFGYASAQDPEFRKLIENGSSNIFVRDLLKGTTHRLTTMGPNQIALFPHFRSDGWLYFQVFDRNKNERYVVTSDAVIVMEQQGD